MTLHLLGCFRALSLPTTRPWGDFTWSEYSRGTNWCAALAPPVYWADTCWLSSTSSPETIPHSLAWRQGTSPSILQRSGEATCSSTHQCGKRKSVWPRLLPAGRRDEWKGPPCWAKQSASEQTVRIYVLVCWLSEWDHTLHPFTRSSHTRPAAAPRPLLPSLSLLLCSEWEATQCLSAKHLDSSGNAETQATPGTLRWQAGLWSESERSSLRRREYWLVAAPGVKSRFKRESQPDLFLLASDSLLRTEAELRGILLLLPREPFASVRESASCWF